MPRPAAFLLSAALCAIGVVQAVTPQPQSTQSQTFRTGIDLVQVDVSVLDRDRRPVRDLKAADFTLTVDGAPTPIEAFTAVDIGAVVDRPKGGASWPRTIAADVVRNDLPRQGRVLVVLFDHSIRPQQMPLARRIAEAAVDGLGPTDIAAVMHTLGGLREQNLTQDRDRLRAAINSAYIGLPTPSLFGPPGNRTAAVSESFGGPAVDSSQCPCGLCSLDTIRQVAESLLDLPARRKSLLFLGTNVRTLDTLDPSQRCAGTEFTRERMLRALGVANLTVHTVDPTGLESLSVKAEDPRRSVVTPSIVGDRTENLKRQGNLQALAAETGGRAVANANQPQDVVASILNESSSYYSLAFRPREGDPPGSYHSISVRVNRRDTSVHARKGYYSGGGPAPAIAREVKHAKPALTEAIANSWPVSDIPVAVAVAPFADLSGPRPVAMIALGSERTTDIGSTAPVDVLIEAFDRDGRSVNYHHQALDMGSALAASGSGRFEIHSRLPLDPGRYELRAGILDGASNRVGTVHTYVDVPDFARAPLSMSGLVLEALPGPLSAPRAVAEALGLQPTTRRTFERSDQITAMARIYQGGDPAQTVMLVVRVTDAAGRHLRDESRSVNAEAFVGTGARAFELRQSIALDDLPPGEYLLSLQATRGDRKELRQARFTIR